MDHSYSNTKPHQKGKRLKLNDRTTIQELHSKGYSNRAIARELNCSPSTVGYELKRGTVSVYRYKAVEGQSTYELHRIKSLSLSQPTTDLSSQIYPILSKFPRLLCTTLTLIHPVIKAAQNGTTGLSDAIFPRETVWISTVWKILLRSRYGATLFLGRS